MPDERCSRRYDWAVVQRYYDEGHSVAECASAFGFSTASWYQAVQRGAIAPRPAATPIEVLFAPGTQRSRTNLKRRLVLEGIKEDRCEACGIDRWCGAPISVALHHVNGDPTDNRIENLQLLCPNCHSQTSNYSGRKRGPDDADQAAA